MKDERKYHEIQNDKDAGQARQARESDQEQAERKKNETNRLGGMERYGGVSETMIDILGQNPHFYRDQRLQPEEQLALEILHKVKVGQNEEGAPANARTRRLLLNQALAALQPVLSLALDPSVRKTLMSSYKKVQNGVTDLRAELKTAQLKEMHSGKSTLKAAAQKKLGATDAEVAENANLAWELVQLWKKRKKRGFRHNLAQNPVGNALAAIADKATAIATAAAATVRVGEKLSKEPKQEAGRELLVEWEQAGAELIEAVRQFVAMCDGDGGDAAALGAYRRALLPRFAPLAERFASLTSLQDALEAGSAILEEVLWCESNQDEIVAAEAEK